MNQVMMRVYEDGASETVPALGPSVLRLEHQCQVCCLGDSWGQCVNTQVRLYWNDSVRQAGIYKSPNLEQKAVSYKITSEGIRSVAN